MPSARSRVPFMGARQAGVILAPRRIRNYLCRFSAIARTRSTTQTQTRQLSRICYFSLPSRTVSNSQSQCRRSMSGSTRPPARKVSFGHGDESRRKIERFHQVGYCVGGIAALLSGFGLVTFFFGDKQRVNAYDVFVGQPTALLPSNKAKSNEDGGNEDQSAKILSQSPRLASNLYSPKIIFVGTGSSTGCPRPLCALLFPPEEERKVGKLDSAVVELQKQYESSCKVSRLAVQGNSPKENKNYRNNPSILISHVNDDVHLPDPEEVVSQTWKKETQNEMEYNVQSATMPVSAKTLKRKNVIIDVGKTFREGALRWLPPNNIHSLDAIVLTHGHMDSIGGLDDVRGFQKRRSPLGTNIPAAVSTPGPKGGLAPMPVFLNQATMDAVERQFHYLVPSVSGPALAADLQIGGSSTIRTVKPVQRLVAALDYKIIEDFEPFYAAGLKMIPLPVMHGEDMVCLGYAFSLKQPVLVESEGENEAIYQSRCVNIVYLSDISRMLPETEKYIVNRLPPTDILILDSLLQEGHNATHQSMREAIDLAKRIGSEKVYLVGMNCDDFLPHDEMNDKLRAENHTSGRHSHEKVEIDVQLAHDGLVLDFKNYRYK